MLKNFIWAVGVRPSLDFGCAQAGLRINAQSLRGLPRRKCVPWERLEFRRRMISTHDVLSGHKANRKVPLAYTPSANYAAIYLAFDWLLVYVTQGPPIVMKSAIQSTSRETINFR